MHIMFEDMNRTLKLVLLEVSLLSNTLATFAV
jgi:hypothetical protein